eukprot:jgi/Chrzof1/14238/Cz08g30200.t1
MYIRCCQRVQLRVYEDGVHTAKALDAKGTDTGNTNTALKQTRALTQPAAKALAVPTILVLNMFVHQYWQATKAANDMPIMKRAAIKPAALVTMAMQNTQGAVKRRHKLIPKRGP